MKAVNVISGTGLPLKRSDVDTDQIIPAEWLKRVERTGLREGPVRHVARRPRLRAQRRALRRRVDHRRRAVVRRRLVARARRVGDPAGRLRRRHRARASRDIFRNNCAKNGLVPVTVPERRRRADLGGHRRRPADADRRRRRAAARRGALDRARGAVPDGRLGAGALPPRPRRRRPSRSATPPRSTPTRPPAPPGSPPDPPAPILTRVRPAQRDESSEESSSDGSSRTSTTPSAARSAISSAVYPAASSTATVSAARSGAGRWSAWPDSENRIGCLIWRYGPDHRVLGVAEHAAVVRGIGDDVVQRRHRGDGDAVGVAELDPLVGRALGDDRRQQAVHLVGVREAAAVVGEERLLEQLLLADGGEQGASSARRCTASAPRTRRASGADHGGR